MLPSGPAPLVLERILGTGLPALIVFETPGCGPCESLRPTLDELAGEFHDRILVVRVIDSAEGLARRPLPPLVRADAPLLAGRRGMQCRIKGNPGQAAVRAHLRFLLTGECPPEPAEGPRHTLVARFGGRPGSPGPRALLCT